MKTKHNTKNRRHNEVFMNSFPFYTPTDNCYCHCELISYGKQTNGTKTFCSLCVLHIQDREKEKLRTVRNWLAAINK